MWYNFIIREKIRRVLIRGIYFSGNYKKEDISISYISVLIFQLQTDFDFFQVTIPMDKGLSDYKEAMYKAVETVALAEHKSIEQVMLFLLNPSADILKIRLII